MNPFPMHVDSLVTSHQFCLYFIQMPVQVLQLKVKSTPPGSPLHLEARLLL